MITKKKDKTILPLTEDLAKKFAGMEPLPGEREIKEKRVSFLDHLVNEGNFFGPEWADVFERSTGNTYRGDGQHSSVMLSRRPEGTFPEGLSASITHYEIDSVAEDGLNLFEAFNNPESVRTAEDVMGVGRAAYTELMSIRRKFLIKVAHGISAFLRDKNEEKQAAFQKALKKIRKRRGHCMTRFCRRVAFHSTS